ncbi:roadblock/LC7 domain-containing protein [Streptomyces sp. 7-21]|jgi:predicted regulator of Ras-like GTPase activity (Roadblock/LC7/MglB family)|nr:roadblock/LC7 domain-containing protein [Streptomyces sp. 7-21]
MDWLLRDLAQTVPEIRHIVVLSADGLCLARYHATREEGERIAAAASGINSLARSLAAELPDDMPRLPQAPSAPGVTADEDVRVVVVELTGGLFYLMSAGDRSYLAVTASHEADPGLVSNRMRDLVLRIGEHLSSAPRAPERAAP